MSANVKSKIPFVDLKAQYAAIRPEIDEAIARVIANTSFILGPEVEAFEREFAAYTGFEHVVGVSNGTEAVHLALRASGLQPGDEVVAPAHTFVATTEAITQAGCKVRLCDVSDATFCTTAETLSQAATPETRGVVPVPIYGNPAGLDETIARAKELGLKVVVDAAQAHGARLGGKRLGELADVATYSFFPGKNLGAYGDAGAVATNDPEIARRARMWRNHGREGKFAHEFEAFNSRMDGMQGAILRAKLPHLADWCEARRTVARAYGRALEGVPGLVTPAETDGAEHAYHLYVVRVQNRDALRKSLGEQGIASGIHYPDPVHLYPAYAYLGCGEGSFPVAEQICREILSLPIYPELPQEDVERVASAVAAFLKG